MLTHSSRFSLSFKTIAVFLTAITLIWFFAITPNYNTLRDQSALHWITTAWNAENDYEHGFLFPFLIIALIAYRYQDIRRAASEGSYLAVIVILIGVMFYWLGHRALQPRITLGALPILLWGCSWYFWGWKSARILFFAFFFFYLAIPLPSFQQATVHLQLIATHFAYFGAKICGVETLMEGTRMMPIHGKWGPLEIAGGCSGIRSLMALLMISYALAFLSSMAFWKRVILFLAAIPIAILGNGLRISSIFVFAEYLDPNWAKSTWHDWSGLLLFYPISVFLLLQTQALLQGRLPFSKKQKKILVKRQVTASSDQP